MCQWALRLSLALCLLLLLGAGSRAFAAATLGNGARMQVLGIGTAALLGGDLTDPENDGNESAGPTDPSWNWKSISSNAEPGFGGGEYSFNVFDNVGEGGGNNKWCCGEPVTASTLAANPLHITVQLHERHRLTHFTITSGNDTVARDPRDWQILGSNDGYTFEPIFTQTHTNATSSTSTSSSLWGADRNEVIKFTLDSPSRPYTYFRFQCTATYSTPPLATATAFFQITEIEYFGLPGGALTIELLGTGTAALLKGDVTDPDNNGNKAAGPTDPSWNWASITSNNKPAFGDDGAFNLFDNAVDGSTNKWCCDDATAANPLSATVEFPRGLILTHFTITSADGDPSGDPTKFQILGSNDGMTFTPIYTRDSATSLWTARNQVVRIDLENPSPLYKFICYEATETPGPTHQLAEIEYFGKFVGLDNPVPSDIAAGASFALLQVTDGADTKLAPQTVQLLIDGQAAATTLDKVGTVTTITHTRSPLFASGSTHTWAFTAYDDAGNRLTRSGSFTVAAYTTINAAYALASADTAKRGFRARVHQMDIYRNPATGLVPNAERQIANGYIDPVTAAPYVNGADLSTAGPDGRIEIPGVVNWNSTEGSSSGAFPNDEPVPGIPGFGVSPADRYVVSIETILELKAGISYRFAVNSDDGFRLSFGWGPGDVGGTQLGTAGDRSFAESTMDVIVPADGFYPVRLMYWETGGGDGCEFYTVKIGTGERILINDPNNPNAVKAYQDSPVSRPYVSRTLPTVNYGYAFADQDVVIDITDGVIPLNAGSVILRINNVDQTVTATKAGNVTTVRRASSLSNLLFSGANNVTLVYAYTSGGNPVSVTNTWAFNVPAYTWPIPAANKVLTSQVSGAGFSVKVHQIDRSGDANQGNGGRYSGQGGSGNNMPRPEIQFASGYINLANNQPYPNLAVPGPNADKSYDILDVLNWNSGTGGAAANAGIFNADIAVPGLPGGGTSGSTAIGLDNIAYEITTYLELKAGAHIFGINVDDGWMCLSAPNPRDTLGTLLGFRNAPGGQNGNPVHNPNAAFNVIVTEDGIYPFRILFWQGGGGVNLEFLQVDRQTGTQILINDLGGNYPSVVANPGNTISSITAYNVYSGPTRPWIKFSVYPMPYIGVTNPRVNAGAAVTLWQNQHQQSGPGPITVKVGSGNPADIANDAPTIRPFGDAIGAVVADLGSGAVGMVLDGANVTPTVTDIPNSTDKLVLYTPATPLSSSSNHIAGLVYARTTNYWIFNVITNVSVPVGAAVPYTRLDPNKIGFRAKVVQSTSARPAGNTVAAAEAQLTGTPANVAIPGPAVDGSYILTNIINLNDRKNTGGSGVEIGNFQSSRTGTPDDPVPGIPGTGAALDNIAAEIFAYLDLPAGYQKFGINGDDGWRVQIGTPGQTSGTVLFSIDRGAGARDIPFAFITPAAGLYPIRLVWYEGGGDGNVEFFSYGSNNEKIPINDRRNANAIKAYYDVIPVPTVAITGPTNGTIHPVFPTNITITADASILNDSIVKVEFFSGTIKIGEATSAPYSIVLSNVPEGRYALTAKATAANGFSTVSAPVRITVGIPVIVNVVETGGDNEATDTVTAKWTGVTFINGVANEPIPNTAASDPYTVEYFVNEAPAFVDRNHQWEGASSTLPLPAYLVGAEYIMSGNDNRDNTAYKLDITLSVDALVYLLIDNRLGEGNNADPPNYPNWLGDRSGTNSAPDGLPDMAWVVQQGWQPVTNGLNRTGNAAWPDEVGVDESADADIDQWSSVYVKRMPAGTFSIYQADNHGQNMYGVVVRRVPAVAPVFAVPVLNRDGTVTISWTGTGTLEETSSLASPITWTPAANQANPQTVTATGTKFYRLRQ
jgi:hypothetical protein